MAPITDLTLSIGEDQEQLRFTATILNVGAGPLEIRAVRPRTGGAWTVHQRIFHPGGSELRRATADLRFGGDGHDHWHVRDLEVYELRRADGTPFGRQVKRGFCFFDTTRWFLRGTGGPREGVYAESRCAGRRAVGLTMGLSRGWGDEYFFALPDQFVDVTGVPAGRYRLSAIVDDQDRFLESDEGNNVGYVDLRLSRRGGELTFRVLGRSRPPARRPAP